MGMDFKICPHTSFLRVFFKYHAVLCSVLQLTKKLCAAFLTAFFAGYDSFVPGQRQRSGLLKRNTLFLVFSGKGVFRFSVANGLFEGCQMVSLHEGKAVFPS
ncbi:hypothetical protein [Desulfovibrio piger]|uniref:hypothetical protein n=1 Tax=Desulfovibrio piger TaxID=901 RepID=UPI0026F2F849|nr:hypothetical protein [Desulfovibrio piger]